MAREVHDWVAAMPYCGIPGAVGYHWNGTQWESHHIREATRRIRNLHQTLHEDRVFRIAVVDGEYVYEERRCRWPES